MTLTHITYRAWEMSSPEEKIGKEYNDNITLRILSMLYPIKIMPCHNEATGRRWDSLPTKLVFLVVALFSRMRLKKANSNAAGPTWMYGVIIVIIVTYICTRGWQEIDWSWIMVDGGLLLSEDVEWVSYDLDRLLVRV